MSAANNITIFVGLFVCLFVCLLAALQETNERIFIKFSEQVGQNAGTNLAHLGMMC